jgi:hypothetical protein
VFAGRVGLLGVGARQKHTRDAEQCYQRGLHGSRFYSHK